MTFFVFVTLYLCVFLCLWEFFVCACASVQCVLCCCVCACVCVSYICSSKASVCGSLCVSAASFIPPDIPASFLWAQEQLATPVGHSHNETITIYEPGATHSLIYTHTHICTQESIYSMQGHTLSWLLLICFLLCCCVTGPSGSNSRSGLITALFSFTSQDMRRFFIVRARAKTRRSSFSVDFRPDAHIFLPTRL